MLKNQRLWLSVVIELPAGCDEGYQVMLFVLSRPSERCAGRGCIRLAGDSRLWCNTLGHLLQDMSSGVCSARTVGGKHGACACNPPVVSI